MKWKNIVYFDCWLFQ